MYSYFGGEVSDRFIAKSLMLIVKLFNGSKLIIEKFLDEILPNLNSASFNKLWKSIVEVSEFVQICI